ncbi:MAG TPA: helix-turn-helix transcriptional regulator [Rhizomicrobium sp.]|nr:helix-turn-helix transcriptional regulator [Rhizomicrobium sp.]
MTETMKPKAPRAIDAAVGAYIRRCRKQAGFSQTQLANGVGVTFQQIQKYERGANRITVSRLAEICRVLQCSLVDLIADIDPLKSAPAAEVRPRKALTRMWRTESKLHIRPEWKHGFRRRPYGHQHVIQHGEPHYRRCELACLYIR